MNVIDLLGILPYFMSLLLSLVTVSGMMLVFDIVIIDTI